MHRFNWFVFLGAMLSICACAPIPIANSGERQFLPGYNILPPDGKGWQQMGGTGTPKLRVEDAQLQVGYINKHDWNQEVESEWGIDAWRYSTKPLALATMEGLKREVDFRMIPKIEPGWGYRTSELYFDEDIKDYCAVTQDAGSYFHGGRLDFAFVTVGKACRDPNNPDSFVWIKCSDYRRTAFEALNDKLQTQCDRVLRSLEFSAK